MDVNMILEDKFNWNRGIRGVILVFLGYKNSMNEYYIYDF